MISRMRFMMILFWSGKDKDFVTGRHEVASSVEQVTEGARANDDGLRVRIDGVAGDLS